MSVHGDAQGTTRQKHLQGLLQNIPSGKEILPCATASAATCYGWVHCADKIGFTLQHFSCRCFSQGKDKGFKHNWTKNRICSQTLYLYKDSPVPVVTGEWQGFIVVSVGIYVFEVQIWEFWSFLEKPASLKINNNGVHSATPINCKRELLAKQ